MLSRTLDIPEISLQIFELVFAGKNGYPDLAGLARTCKSFNEPALAILWRTQSSLLPLVLCFPRDVLELSQADDSAQQTVKFLHPPSTQDWERPFVYAKHIKIIKFELPCWFSESYVLHSSVLRTLLDSCPTLPVLSRLRELEHASIFNRSRRSGDVTYMNVLTKLSSPTVLQSLELLFPTDVSAEVAREYLGEVMKHCENIESFVARFGDKSLPFAEYFVAFASLQKLRSLVVRNEVRYNTRPRDIVFPTSFTTGTLPNSFPSLVKLELYDFSVSAAFDILKAVRSTNLQETHFFATRDNLDNLFSYLASQLPWQESMRSITIRNAMVSAQGLDHLLVFKNLRRLTIHSTALDDRKIDVVSKAWPLLEDLSIMNEAPSPQHVQVTLNSLVSLQTHCPRLQHLELRLDASEIPTLQAGSQPNNANADANHGHVTETSHLMRTERPSLFLGIDVSSTIRNSAGVADFLMALFPRAQIAPRFFNWTGDTQGAALWSRVAKVIDERLGQVPQPVPRFTMFQTALPVLLAGEP